MFLCFLLDQYTFNSGGFDCKTIWNLGVIDEFGLLKKCLFYILKCLGCIICIKTEFLVHSKFV